MEQESQLDRETFSCSICLDLLKHPVAIPCGHSYCMSCIKSFWDGEDQRKVYSCPQCRQTFTLRPDLAKNTMLAALVEQLKKSGIHDAPFESCYAGPEDMDCDVCTGRKLKAHKSCLVCLISYCEEHLQLHYELPAFRKHRLVDPSEQLQENICSRHGEVKKMFCRTDQGCICYLCSLDEHRGHDTVSATAERTERQRELEASRRNVQQRIQDSERDLKLLQQEVEDIDHAADKAAEDSDKIFSELVHLIQKRSSDVKQLIGSRRECEISRVRELQAKLEQQLSELRGKDAELKQLSLIDNHNQFLHHYPSLSQHGLVTDPLSIDVRSSPHFEDVSVAVLQLVDQIQDVLMDSWTSGSLVGTELDDFLPEEEPKTRDGFLKYSCEITLDPNTAYTLLMLTEGNRRAERTTQHQAYSTHPDRFTVWPQVLSKESLTGRCYWEVERRGRVYVAVAYQDIGRAGRSRECGFGCNSKSWMLDCDAKTNTFFNNSVSTPVSGPHSSRIGVYLDHAAGVMSFYSVSDTMTLLHRVQTTFTQPLYAGLYLYPGVTAEFCKII